MTQPVRNHARGNAHILAAIAKAAEPSQDGDTLVSIGNDDRGIELTIIAVPNDKGNGLAVIHAMPTHY